ncbi:MAG: DUF1175 domain-containing protein [Acidobacteriaceae bacterium]|nr:DUF1175 domain-containing protein [Acidobacteriaceae bacterium]
MKLWQGAGLIAITPAKSLPADGQEHSLALIGGRYHLPVRASQLTASGDRLRLEDTSEGVVLWLRTPVQPGRLRAVVRGRGGVLELPVRLTSVEEDSFGDGTPDWMRLHAATDREAFRRWFTELAERAADTPPERLPPEITDCASLLRYAYRETLRQHDDRWYKQFAAGEVPSVESVQQWSYPNTPLGAGLFRVRPGPFRPTDPTDGSFAQFADAKTLMRYSTHLVSRDARAALPGDLIFYRVLESDSQYHSMIVTGGQGGWIVYHTGPIGKQRGQMRRVLLSELLHHPDPRWRPEDANPNFLGVFRWNILR